MAGATGRRTEDQPSPLAAGAGPARSLRAARPRGEPREGGAGRGPSTLSAGGGRNGTFLGPPRAAARDAPRPHPAAPTAPRAGIQNRCRVRTAVAPAPRTRPRGAEGRGQPGPEPPGASRSRDHAGRPLLCC
ncbi:Hypothetical predicted protein [Marmota monax]|uniref:Uncharacterized protein n=1 Tax=Marmota monax TaxID=9995 RepID=A0A5E4C1A2_MARMO|nr:hypothetical protein GHT09_007036 [Marmota monax]VTJ74929.1 Hypothetical predicted protein [Marmota monax]